jgi:hypothetical protein
VSDDVLLGGTFRHQTNAWTEPHDLRREIEIQRLIISRATFGRHIQSLTDVRRRGSDAKVMVISHRSTSLLHIGANVLLRAYGAVTSRQGRACPVPLPDDMLTPQLLDASADARARLRLQITSVPCSGPDPVTAERGVVMAHVAGGREAAR